MEFATPFSGVFMELGNSYKIVAPQCGVFMECHYHIVEFFFLTLTTFNIILLEFSR